MLSPTRRNLEDRRKRRFLTVGILDFASAAVWAKIADLSLAEGKKLEGALEVIIACCYGFLGFKHTKSAKS